MDQFGDILQKLGLKVAKNSGIMQFYWSQIFSHGALIQSELGGCGTYQMIFNFSCSFRSKFCCIKDIGTLDTSYIP